MNKTTLIVGVVIIVIVLAGGLLYYKRHKSAMMMQENPTPAVDTSQQNPGATNVSPTSTSSPTGATSTTELNQDLNSLDQAMPSDADLGSDPSVGQ